MTVNEARFVMFRRTPEGPSGSKLASSMQSFESAIFLLALQRYPHALSTTVFALESALTSRPPTTKSTKLQMLLEDARSGSQRMSDVDQDKVYELRKTRNRIVHHGFVPRDDGPCAMLFLQAAVPLLSAAYLDFYEFDLFDGLLPEIATHLRIAMDASAMAVSVDDRDGTRFLVLLEHLVRVRVQVGTMSAASATAARRASETGIVWEEKSRRRDDLKEQLDPYWITSCPACDEPDALVCELSERALDAGTPAVSRAYCAACDLAVPVAKASVLNLACRAELARDKVRVLADFGIVPK